MILPFITIIISFILESILSKYISINTMLFSPLFTLITLVIIYPYFHKDEKKYLIYSLIIGLFYDIVYTNTIFLNAFLFFIIAIIIKKINTIVSNNGINVAIISLIIIIIYRIITFLILCLVGYLVFNIKDLLYSIASSLVLNMIYSIILYLITDFISKKKHIVKID